MLAWMVYVVAVGLLLSGAAFAAERSAQIRGAPTRWLWGASIIGCLVLPSVIASVSIRIPSFSSVAGQFAPPAPFALRQLTLGAMQPSAWLDTTIGPLVQTASADALLTRAWIAASALIFLAILGAGVLLLRRQHQGLGLRVRLGDPARHDDAGPQQAHDGRTDIVRDENRRPGDDAPLPGALAPEEQPAGAQDGQEDQGRRGDPGARQQGVRARRLDQWPDGGV